eukprot:CAMPEP_0206155120 /NCGR_PEP_ID=MMETSP1474-20131121/1899_1 /ASSEMBLY_ACC=CAM_ASM_001110 /TAXON_ID=97495 /ORGANISM="Imantonia sp., Strain RCC918" /LENGTH=122 /DNA_ID=CAMNT_0053553649 /DNA_START=472 /DNA_END=841 /DNA_ORIENTATION=+
MPPRAMNALALVQRYVIGALHGLAPSEPLDCGGLLVATSAAEMHAEDVAWRGGVRAVRVACVAWRARFVSTCRGAVGGCTGVGAALPRGSELLAVIVCPPPFDGRFPWVACDSLARPTPTPH